MIDGCTTLFLTGGTGFFGRALLRHMLASGEEIPRVDVLSRNPSGFLAAYPQFADLPWLGFVCGNIEHPDTLPRDRNYDAILHAAADSTLGPRLSPLQRYRQIVDGTTNLLNFACDVGARRFLLVSSGAVYGPQPPEMERIDESYMGMPDPLIPSNAYGVAKRSAEHLCALYSDRWGIETVVARCFAFVGPDLPIDAHFAIGNFIRDALWADEIVVQGDGSAVRSYMSQQDLAKWLSVLLEKGCNKRAYNVGSNHSISILQLANRVRGLLAPDKPIRILGEVDDGHRNIYVPDVSRALKELGLDILTSLDTAIMETAAAAQSMRLK